MAKDGRKFKTITDKVTGAVIEIRTDGDLFWATVNNSLIKNSDVKAVEGEAIAAARAASQDNWTPIITIAFEDLTWKNHWAKTMVPKVSAWRSWIVRKKRADGMFKGAEWSRAGLIQRDLSSSYTHSYTITGDEFPLPYLELMPGTGRKLTIEYSEEIWQRIAAVRQTLAWVNFQANEKLKNEGVDAFLGYLERTLSLSLIDEAQAGIVGDEEDDE